MLQDISPHIYHNPMSFLPPSAGDLVLAYTEGGVLARREAELLQLPTVSQCPNVSGWTYAFSIDDVRYYLPQEVPQVPTFSPVSNYRANGPRETAFACAVGESLSRWYAGNRFCGACGTPLAHSTLERAMVCPALRPYHIPQNLPGGHRRCLPQRPTASHQVRRAQLPALCPGGWLQRNRRNH